MSRTCTRCHITDNLSIPAAGHSYGEWIVEKKATCTDKGLRARTCSRCGDRIEQEIAAIGGDHHFVNGVCTRCGASQYENTNTAASSAGQADTGSSLSLPLSRDSLSWLHTSRTGRRRRKTTSPDTDSSQRMQTWRFPIERKAQLLPCR